MEIREQTGAIQSDSAGPKGRWLTIGALLAVAAVPYLNALGNGFVYDDHQQILTNPYLRSFHYLRPIFTTSVWSFLGGSAGVTNYYRPLMLFGYLMCYRGFGANAFVFHLVNLLMHLAVVLLVYKLTARLFGDRNVAILAALIFALHPIHTESVDWVGAVTDIELTLFFLAGFWFYLGIPRLTTSRPSRRWVGAQAGVLVCMALGLLSKEQAVMLPVVSTIFEHLYRDDRGRTTIAEKIARYAPAWALVPIYLLVRAHFLGAFMPSPSRSGLALEKEILSAGALLFQYVAKMLWPARLSAYYVFPGSWSVLLPQVLGGILVVLASAALFAFCWRRARMVSFGLIWFLVTLLPVLNIRIMPTAAFAERYLYLPSVGFCWILAWSGTELVKWAELRGKPWRVVIAAAAALLAFLAAARIVVRNRDWRDDVRFYQSALAASPNSYAMHADFGKYYWELGQRQLAEREWRAAAAIEPDAVVVLSNLGLLLTEEQRYDEAVADLKRAVQIAPNDTGSHIDLGLAYQKMGLEDDAGREFQTAVRLSPLSILAHDQLGQVNFDEDRFADAEAQFHASLALQPNLAAWFGLGLSRWRQGDTSEAQRDFKAAETLEPGDPRVHFMLALLYGADGRYPEAFAEYAQGFKIDPDNQTALDAFHRLQEEAANESASPETGSAHQAH